MDSVRDDWFERRLRQLLVLVVLVALLFTGGNAAFGGKQWAEMPSDRALLRAERGPTTAVVNGQTIVLTPGQDLYVGESDTISVPDRSRATLTYHGGSVSILCAGARLSMGRLVTRGDPVAPTAAFRLDAGLALTDTTSASPAFQALAATVSLPGGVATNAGPAWFAADTSGVAVSSGQVTFAGATLAPTHENLGCGDGEGVVAPPVLPGTPSPTPVETTPPVIPSSSPSPTPTPTPGPTTTRPKPSRTTQPPPTIASTTTRPPPPPNQAPVIVSVGVNPSVLAVNGCPFGDTIATITASVTDADDQLSTETASFDYTMGFVTFVNNPLRFDGTNFVGTVGPFVVDVDTVVPINVHVTDIHGAPAATWSTQVTVSTFCVG